MAKGTEAATNLKDKLVGFVTKYRWYVLLVVIAAAYFLFLSKKL